MDRATAIILTQSKSLGIGLLLTFFFGGFGVFYVSTVGGIVASIIQGIGIILTIITFGVGALLLFPFHLICIIWVAVAVKKHNERLVSRSV